MTSNTPRARPRLPARLRIDALEQVPDFGQQRGVAGCGRCGGRRRSCGGRRALHQQLALPQDRVTEFHRVLKPEGSLGVCSPDWGGFLIAPPSAQLTAAIDEYKNLQIANGGDVYVGRKLSRLLDDTGFEDTAMHARYEVYESLELIGEYLAIQLEDAGETAHASTLRRWTAGPNGMFAQAWVWCTARKSASA